MSQSDLSHYTMPLFLAAEDTAIRLSIKFHLGEGYDINPEVDSSLSASYVTSTHITKTLNFSSDTLSFEIPTPYGPETDVLTLAIRLFHCKKKPPGLCFFKDFTVHQPIELSSAKGSSALDIAIDISLES
ncbi:MAG: hypothetical protein OEZ36_03895 [Spirochaetota bacterium]|nr:hypothetical protein [Spirochaetota bacterium]